MTEQLAWGEQIPLASELIVCERTGRWARLLRRTGLLAPLRLYETRSWSDCRQRLGERPCSLVVLELREENIAAALKQTMGARVQFPRSRVVIAAAPRLASLEWLFREAGAVHAQFSVRDVEPIVRIVQRIYQAEQQRTPRLQLLPRQSELLDPPAGRLPWGDVAEHNS